MEKKTTGRHTSFMAVIIAILTLLCLGCTEKKDDSGDQAHLKLVRCEKTVDYTARDYDYDIEYSNVDVDAPDRERYYYIWLTMNGIDDDGIPRSTYIVAEHFVVGEGIDLSGTLTGRFTLPYPGTYEIKVTGGQNRSAPLAEGNILTINTPKAFKIIQLQMTGDELWQSFHGWVSTDPPVYRDYDATSKRFDAFKPANTFVAITTNTMGISNQVSPPWSVYDDVRAWAVKQTGGDLTKPHWGLDPNKSILCGIDDVPQIVLALHNPDGSQNNGFTEQRLYNSENDAHPSFSFVLYTRIQTQFTGDYDRARALMGAAIHELGHAREITGDDNDALHPLTPPHSADDPNGCVMHNPGTVEMWTSPKFCNNHLTWIKSITW